MRVTQQTITMQALDRLQSRLSRLSESQSRLASGKSFARPSDSPAAMNRSMLLRSQEDAADQAEQNIGDGLMWTSLADSKLQTLLDRLHRVRDLAIRSGSVSNDSERQAFAAEIEEIRSEGVAIANSRIGDRGLFSGHQQGDAVVWDGTAWAYQGDTGRVIRRAGPADEVEVNLTGDQVFGANGELFNRLDDLAGRILAADDAGVQTSITEMDDSMDRILSGLADLGAATNRLEAAQQRGSSEILSLRQRLSEVESVDVAEAITKLQMEEVAYQATLGALARSLQPSLVDFLR